MRNKIISGVMFLLLIGTAASARDYNLDERAEINLAAVDEVIFDLRGVSCSLCIRSSDTFSEISGDGRGSAMILSLAGRISTNREKAVPSLIVEEGGRRVTVRLYPDRRTFFGLNQSGRADFTAVLPANYAARVTVTGASDDILVRNLSLESLTMESSSGDVEARDIEADAIELEVSSGDLRGGDLASGGLLTVDSSSGKIALGELSGTEVSIEASSGDITINRVSARTNLKVKASSGRIGIGELTAGTADISSSSGRITVDSAVTETLEVELSSGNADLGRVDTGSFSATLSSGDLKVGILNAEVSGIKTSGDTVIASAAGAFNLEGSSGVAELGFASFDGEVRIDVSSGDIILTLPGDSRFNTELKTSSGRIRSDFPVMGNLSSGSDGMTGTVNGGGPLLKAETASGDIRLLVR